MSAAGQTRTRDPDDIAFRFEIDAETLASALDSVTVLVDECKIRLEDDGISIRAVDPANVGMVDLDLAPSAFETYQPHGGVIGVNLDRLTDIVGMADSDDVMEFLLDEETRKLHIEFAGLEYTMALIDPDSIRQEPDLPDLDLDGEVVCEGSDLARSIKAADMVSDHAAFGIDPDAEQFTVDAEGDTDDVHLELDREDLIDLTASNAKSLFSLDYLKDVAKPINADDEVTLELGEEFPVKMHIDREDTQVTFMVAPRIESD